MNLFNINNDIDYLIAQAGKEILINGASATAIIGSMSSNKEYDDKKIITRSSINRGNIVNYNNGKYLVISEINDMRFDTYYKGIMRKCNYNIKFNFSGVVKEFNAIIETQILDIDTGQFISVPSGKIIVTLQDNQETQKIQLQNKFIKMGSAWQIQGIDKSKVGLLILHCEVTTFGTNDDKENEIIDGLTLPPAPDVYDVQIINNPNVTIGYYTTWQIQWVVTKNGQVVNEPVSFVSSNVGAVTVDSSGLCQAKNINSSATITVKLSSNPTIYTTMRINVTNTSSNYTVDITGVSEIILGETKEYNAVVKNNGIEVSDAEVVWELNYNSNPQTIVQLRQTSINKRVEIVANNANVTGIIYLTAKYKNDLTKLFSKQIEISDGSLW